MAGAPADGKIDVHFHLIPQFYRDAVYEAGTGPAIGRFPDWTPALALDLMDRHGIALALLSLAQPGVAFLPNDKAAAFARRCNDYAAELIGRHPERFGCFGLLPMHDIDAAIAEARYCLETLRFEGICLFASYGETFLGDAAFDPLLAYLHSAKAVVHVHPSLHPSSRSLTLPWPGFMIEYVFDTTRAAVNLLFTGALDRFAGIRFILSHAGGTLPYLAWRLSVAPMIDKRLKQRSREEIFAGLKTFWYDNALASGIEPMGALSRIAARERIVFGSDWPFCNDGVVTEEVADFTAPGFLAPETIAMIARKNALALFPKRAAQFG
ncbi:MAG TPA: amidohydrolase family protein [Xanthobacteraceae bacterium]|nr:amidohydrolase family protein [Xanthobacteraceae bacterium]